MLATPHIITGAAVAKQLRRPWLALPAAFISHFLLDFIPHLDSHALFGTNAGRPTRPEATMAVLDFIFGAALVAVLIIRQRNRRLLAAGAFLGIVIDLVDNVPPWNSWFRAWAGTSWISAFHHAFQHNVAPSAWPIGFGTQVVIVAIGMWVLVRGRRPK